MALPYGDLPHRWYHFLGRSLPILYVCCSGSPSLLLPLLPTRGIGLRRGATRAPRQVTARVGRAAVPGTAVVCSLPGPSPCPTWSTCRVAWSVFRTGLPEVEAAAADLRWFPEATE
jgi:hypothetical protein